VKNLGIRILILALLSLGLAYGNAVAQENAVPIITANVPFSFMVGNTTLPAGAYDFENVGTWEMAVTNAKGDVKVQFFVEPTEFIQLPGAFELHFDVVGGKYFLSKIALQGEHWGFYVPKSAVERMSLKKETIKTEKVTAKKK
jgi:hypothetical protein